jgi:type IV pilus assembly protein PilC
MQFKVKLKKEGGTEETRVMNAPSRFAVYGEAEKEGALVISIEEGGGGFTMPAWLTVNITSGVNMEAKITFTKNLAAMLTAGLPLSRALSVIERQSGSKGLKKVVSDLSESVKKGEAFHEALAAHPDIFPKLYVAMTKAGEESGTLAEALKVIGRQMERSHALSNKIRGAMLYPAIILFAMLVISILMLIYVVPTLSTTFSELGVELPATTKAIIAMSNFATNNVILVFGLLLAIIALGFLFFRSKIGGAIGLFMVLKIPVIGELARETYSARASRTLSSLLSSGVEMLSAISIAQEVVGDNAFGKVLTKAEEQVRKGESLSTSFAEKPDLYPIFVSDMISVGEETGKVADMLGQVAEYYETDVEERTKDLSTIIEPVLMLVIGSGVGVFALSMIAPIYSLSESI